MMPQNILAKLTEFADCCLAFLGVLSFALVSMLSLVVVVRVTIRASEMFQKTTFLVHVNDLTDVRVVPLYGHCKASRTKVLA